MKLEQKWEKESREFKETMLQVSNLLFESKVTVTDSPQVHMQILAHYFKNNFKQYEYKNTVGIDHC